MTLKWLVTKGRRLVARYYRHPAYVLVYAANYLNPSFKSHVRFYSHQEFARQIHQGKSAIRLGDGELYMMTGGSIDYQKYEKGLRLAIAEVVRNYRPSGPYVIALPVFLNWSNIELRNERRFPAFFVWMPGKVMYRLLFPKDIKYGDAHFFYYDGFCQKYLEEYLLDKHLVVVSNQDTVAFLKNNRRVPFRKISFVITPKENSYSRYEQICKDIDAVIESLPKGERVVLLLSTGPASKQLAYDFCRKGVQSLDIGRGLELLYGDESLERMAPELQRNKILNS